MLRCYSYAHPAESIDVRRFVGIPAWIHHEAARRDGDQGETISPVTYNYLVLRRNIIRLMNSYVFNVLTSRIAINRNPWLTSVI